MNTLHRVYRTDPSSQTFKHKEKKNKELQCIKVYFRIERGILRVNESEKGALMKSFLLIESDYIDVSNSVITRLMLIRKYFKNRQLKG